MGENRISMVGTTKRKPLTPRQLLKLWEDHKGICCICGFPIDKDKKWAETLRGPKGFVDEHQRALALGGSNKLANRGPAHIACAAVKTTGDMERINKAKAQKQRDLGIRAAPDRKMPSAPMPKTKKAIERAKREPKTMAVGQSAIFRRFTSV
jgi:hypothetical protein